MIVKNEEKQLPRCLDSIKNVVDEIIIVDTGSSDRTVEIAEQYGCKVFFREWDEGGFSTARNYSLEQATGDWILYIDADEEIDPSSIPAVRDAIESDFDSIIVFVLSKAAQGIAQNFFIRLFRRGTAHFEGSVHNQVVASPKAAIRPIYITHHGYALPRKVMEKKWDRTEGLLKKQLEEDPYNPFTWSNLVSVHRCRGDWRRVIDTAGEFDSYVWSDVARHSTLSEQRIGISVTQALYATERYKDALRNTWKIVLNHGNNVDAWYWLGDIYNRMNKPRRAIWCYRAYQHVLRKAMQLRVYSNVPIDSWGAIGRSLNNIGAAYKDLGKSEKAFQYFQAATLERPFLPAAHENMQRMFAEFADGDALNVLFIQSQPDRRTCDMAKALRAKGHKVALGYLDTHIDPDIHILTDTFDDAFLVDCSKGLYTACDRYDVIHVHNEPDNVAALISEFRPNAVLINDAHDIVERRQVFNPYLPIMTAVAHRHAKGDVYATPQQMEVAARLYGHDITDCIVIYDYLMDTGELPDKEGRIAGFHIVYEGGMNDSHRLVIDEIKAITETGVHVHIYPKTNQQEYEKLDSKMIHYHDPAIIENMIAELAQYDAGLIPVNDEDCAELYRESHIDPKLFRYLAAGIPVLSAKSRAIGWFLSRHEVGFTYEDTEDIPELIEKLEGIEIDRQKFTMEAQIDQLIGFYRKAKEVIK